MKVSKRVIRQEELIYEVLAGGRLRIDTWDAELKVWEVSVERDVSHSTTVKISVVEHV